MRLSLSVNGDIRYTASVSGPGYLSAHLNMKDRPKEDGCSNKVYVQGLETGETETVSKSWPMCELSIGDAVEIRILPEGQSEAPAEVRTSSESPYTLMSDPTLARELLQICADFENRVSSLITKSKHTEPPEEHKKLTRAYGGLLYEMGQHLMYPIYRRHRELIPEELKGELL